MKTVSDIQQDFPGTTYVTTGKGNVFTCQVTLPCGEIVKGLGSTLESAENTAWSGVVITLRDRVPPIPPASSKYKIHSHGKWHFFETLEEAKRVANEFFTKTGVILSIVHV